MRPQAEPGRENRSRARVEWALRQFIISLRGEAVGGDIVDWLVVSENALQSSKLCVGR